MNDTPSVLIRLQDLSQFLANDSLADDLTRHAATAAHLVGAEHCSIMLINNGEGDDLRLSVRATFGTLPAAAWTASIGKGEGIAGHVLDTGRALLVQDIADSPFAHLARRLADPKRSFMLCPIKVDGKIVGMLNVGASKAKATFDEVDLHLLDVIALFIGKSIQVIQLHTILNSRFTQIALAREVEYKLGATIANTSYKNPHQIARILAKSFFREMSKAGFDSAQIIAAASEIIEQLNSSLHRHSSRAAIPNEGGDPR